MCVKEKKKGRQVAWLCASLPKRICVCSKSSLRQVVEGVLICHLALQVKLEISGQLRGRGINNTKGCERERQRRIKKGR